MRVMPFRDHMTLKGNVELHDTSNKHLLCESFLNSIKNEGEGIGIYSEDIKVIYKRLMQHDDYVKSFVVINEALQELGCFQLKFHFENNPYFTYDIYLDKVVNQSPVVELSSVFIPSETRGGDVKSLMFNMAFRVAYDYNAVCGRDKLLKGIVLGVRADPEKAKIFQQRNSECWTPGANPAKYNENSLAKPLEFTSTNIHVDAVPMLTTFLARGFTFNGIDAHEGSIRLIKIL